MNHLLSILLTAILCASVSAQTIKTLGFNSTNGQVVANTTNALHFTNNNIAFNSGDLSLSNGTFVWGGNVRWSPEDNSFDLALAFNGTNTAATTRTNLGVPLAALTNTSNVTMMRALAGSTNTAHPYSGTFEVVGPMGNYFLVFSNGILQDLQ